MSTPRVFVSYSHDDESHKAWVYDLAHRLRVEFGIDVILDEWDVALGSDLMKFMESLTEADRVLMICSDVYVEKCNSDEGRSGVAFEKLLMTARLAQGVYEKTMIPVLRNNAEGSLPRFLGQRLYVNFNDDSRFRENIFKLAAEIHGASVAKPPIGRNPFRQGLDAGFGTSGRQPLALNRMQGRNLFQRNDGGYVVAGVRDHQPTFVFIDGNGASSKRLAPEGIITLSTGADYGDGPPKVIVSDLFVSSSTFLVCPRFSINVKESPLLYQADGDFLTRLPVTGECLDAVLHGERSVMIQTKGQGAGMQLVLLDKQTGALEFDQEAVRFFQSPRAWLQWCRVKRIGDRVYAFGKTSEARSRTVFVVRYDQEGNPDEGFGDQGAVNVGALAFFNQVKDVVERPDGTVLVVGSGNEANLVRLRADGSFDDSFGAGGLVEYRAASRSTCEQIHLTQEYMYLVGQHSDGNSFNDVYLARLYHDGRPDTNFHEGGYYSLGLPHGNEFVDAVWQEDKVTILCQIDRDSQSFTRPLVARAFL